MPSWGATTLNIIQDSNAPPVADGGIVEIPILADPATPDVPASIIQQAGRRRKRKPLDCWVESQAEFAAFETDYYSGQVRTFTDYDSVSYDAVIASINPRRRVFEHYIEFSITFLEA